MIYYMPANEPEVLAIHPGESDATFLKRHRELAGLTQTAVARQAGLSVPYLSLIEAGKKKPPLKTIARIADAIADASRGVA